MSGRIAEDRYAHEVKSEPGEPWFEGFDIEPSDKDELPIMTRDIYVGVGGDVRLVLKCGQELTFKNAPQGFKLGLVVRKVFSTGTTASGMIGLY